MPRFQSHSYGEVVPLNEIEDLSQVAYDLHYFLDSSNNVDIDRYFPKIVKVFTGKLPDIENRLAESQAHFQPGSHESFVTFIGEHAVGISVITDRVKPPEGIKHNWPNIGEFVCRPYRGIGLGKLAVDHCLDVIHKRFDGHAWTAVPHENPCAERLILKSGFQHLPTLSSKENIYVLGKN